MELAISNLSGELAHPEMLGLLHAYDPDLEVEIEVIDLDDSWFEQPDDVIAATADVPPRERGLFSWLFAALKLSA